jgi:hypothetical protein
MLAGKLLSGPLLAALDALPISFDARLCDLRPRFLAKCRVGAGYRAIARNGRVLLASDRPLEDLAGRTAWVRLQIWHRTILPGDPAEAFGILLCVRDDPQERAIPSYSAKLVASPTPDFVLTVDVGGARVLEFRRVVEP